MMLREMVTVDAALVGLSNQFEPLSVLLVGGDISTALDVVEDSEFHGGTSLYSLERQLRRNGLIQAVPD